MAPVFTGNWFGFGRTPDTGVAEVIKASGGDTPAGVAPGNGYRYLFFSGPGNIVVAETITDMYFIVQAGGRWRWWMGF